MNWVTRRINATVTKQDEQRYWGVEPDDKLIQPHHLRLMWLRSQDFISGLEPKIGQKVELRYVRTPSSGLWKAFPREKTMYEVTFHNRRFGRERPATVILSEEQALKLLSLHWPNRDEPDVVPADVLAELDLSVETPEFSMCEVEG